MKTKLALIDECSGIKATVNAEQRFFPTPYLEKSRESFSKISNLFVKKELNEMTILVAEDDKINFLIINFFLKEKVRKVDHAFNGKEAVELAKVNEYDLILMDINMPLMGGIEATQLIKKMYPHLPIIAQTAFTSSIEKVRFVEAGCDDIIYKPIKKILLFEVLQKYAIN